MSQVDSRLANRILLGLVIGALAGAVVLVIGQFVPRVLTVSREISTALLDPFGQVFLRMLFFVVIPLVFASLALGVVQLGKLSDLGPLAGKTFSLFVLNMAIGVALGLLMMNMLDPGGRLDVDTQARLVTEYGSAAQGYVQAQGERPQMSLALLVDMFMPRNLFGAFVGNDRNSLGEVLPLILFAILVGAAGTLLVPERRVNLQDAFETAAELMTHIVRFALYIAPYAVPAMIFSVVVKVGFDIIVALGLFVLGCLGVMVLHLFGTFSLWLKVGTKRKPVEFFRQITPVLVTAFSTSSSNATLPASLATARDTLAVRPSIAGFVLPLGATMNMSGTALYEGCVVLFVAQVFGVDLSLVEQLTLLMLAVMSAIAVAGIPGGSLPLIAGLLVTFGVPPEGIGIVLGVDRILDMARTVVNVGADLVTSVIIEERAPPGS